MSSLALGIWWVGPVGRGQHPGSGLCMPHGGWTSDLVLDWMNDSWKVPKAAWGTFWSAEMEFREASVAIARHLSRLPPVSSGEVRSSTVWWRGLGGGISFIIAVHEASFWKDPDGLWRPPAWFDRSAMPSLDVLEAMWS